MNFTSETGDVSGSFLGEALFFVGVLFLGPSSFTSSFFFIIASLELVLMGLFLGGDGLILTSDRLPLVFEGLLVLPTPAAAVLLFSGVVLGPGLSTETLRAWGWGGDV